MNEELYQHWLALKDVKTLASRLHLLPKFIKIYEDLNFNDQLFNWLFIFYLLYFYCPLSSSKYSFFWLNLKNKREKKEQIKNNLKW